MPPSADLYARGSKSSPPLMERCEYSGGDEFRTLPTPPSFPVVWHGGCGPPLSVIQPLRLRLRMTGRGGRRQILLVRALHFDPRWPPVLAAEEQHDRRHQDCADHEGVEQHPDGDGKAELNE